MTDPSSAGSGLTGPGHALRAGGILIVDDTPANLHLLAGILRQKGHRVRPVPDGTLALRAAEASAPELVLLDISMPGMDGYEVCRQLKARPKLAGIPVIFISALDETLDKVKAFAAGGVDYVTKPFQADEVVARVETHLALRSLRLEVERHNRHLEELVRQRTRELFRAHERLSILDQAKTDFLRLISHELRTPLNGLLGSVEVILDLAPNDASVDQMRALFDRSRVRLLGILEDALLLTQIETTGGAFSLARVPLQRVCDAAARGVAEAAKARGVDLAIEPTDEPVLADEELLTRALRSLLATSVKFASPKSTVRVTFDSHDEEVRVRLESTGRAIPDGVLSRFFDVLAIAEPLTPGGDLGLGPAVAQRLVSLFGGATYVESLDPPGVAFTVKLRRREPFDAPPR